MTLELHIVGPGLDTTQLVYPHETELILGRDINCNVNLPDPERNVSRRHLAVWNEAGELHFRVLSLVNGVDMPFGAVPSGARGVLAAGQVMKICDYSVEVRQALAQAAAADPWAVFEGDSPASDATLPRGTPAKAPAADSSGPMILPEEDPFGDWGFESTYGPGSIGDGLRAVAQGTQAGDMSSFYKGLGLEIPALTALSAAELEVAGKAVRVALDGLFKLYASRGGVTHAVRGEDPSGLPVKDNNPLKTDWPEQTKLQYLFGGRSQGIGFLGPQRALTDLVTELLAHEAAMLAATKGTIEATVQEFAPLAMKDRLLGVGTKLFEGARAWEAYSRYYTGKSEELDGWVQQLLDKHFAPAYLRESQRIKRETDLNSD